MSARDRILGKLRQTQKPFRDVQPIRERRHMIPQRDLSPQEQIQLFREEAEAVGCFVYQLDQNAAFEQIMELIGDDQSVLSWEASEIPFEGLHGMLGSLGVKVAGDDRGRVDTDPPGDVRVGITGVNAALAATGSIVVESGRGRYRNSSLLPDVHIALLRAEQILPDLETWQQIQKDAGYPAFTEASNTTVITGPSKTADIAHQLVKGAHGPREVHVMILD
ncbi:MAG: lactate utilization protein [Chloroflexi bacterium]|nr:lactate utilization protein [Chloroflexota bacterium]